MLARGAGILRDRDAILVDQLDMPGDAIGAVPRDLDLRRPVDIGQVRVTHWSDADAERARRASAHRIDEIVEPRAARRNERLLAEMEHSIEPIRAEGGVRAGAAVVEHERLLPRVDVELVGHAARVLGIDKAARDVAVIAKRL